MRSDRITRGKHVPAPPTFIQKRKLLHVNVQMGELLVFFPRNFHLTDLRQTHAQ
jgi:hypothetical protein